MEKTLDEYYREFLEFCEVSEFKVSQLEKATLKMFIVFVDCVEEMKKEYADVRTNTAKIEAEQNADSPDCQG